MVFMWFDLLCFCYVFGCDSIGLSGVWFDTYGGNGERTCWRGALCQCGLGGELGWVGVWRVGC